MTEESMRRVPQIFALLFILVSSPIHAFYQIAEGEVILDTRLSTGYDSNLFGNASEKGDSFVSLAPTLSWLRSAGLSPLNLSAGLNVTRYRQFTGQNSEDYFGRFSAGFPIPAESAISGNFNLGYSRNTRLDEYIFDRITSDIFNAAVNGAYQLRPNTSLTSSYSYVDTKTGDFKTVTNSGNVGINFSEIFRNLDLGFNYRIRHSRLEGSGSNRDSLDHAFGANLSGPVLPETWLPKVTTSFSLGYDNTLPSAQDKSTTQRIVGSVNANWQARERTTVGLSVSRDLDLSPDQQNVETTRLTLNLGQRIGERMTTYARTSYAWNEFMDQDTRQETWDAGAGLSYSLNNQWNAGADYTFTKNNTADAARKFDRHLMTFYTSYVF